ncbi:uncharacterized protein LAESUDRAFT_757758 [Laetiporus sulphureus 93-53]|uniref:DUF302 domain-containing protein n=1 Tax=Laetiporus sulphureus 93-53 TaxID=1314785 RepID=A0A165EZP1_9APHY|nr:uncharacterized protein LAESUDRAFT_757758 [Laetiporus sulphureus 93-53]KZT08056.1 hypothetical protein LAESUDRAFT_757758 [Laetiporus sulphureus 93-53]
MSKTVAEFIGRRITYESPLPISEVTARLDVELNKDNTGPILLDFLNTVKTREELDSGMKQFTGGNDFVFFSEALFQNWRNAYYGKPTPEIIQYTLGNPLVAETMMRHDIRTALSVPFRILVAERPDGRGTQLSYFQLMPLIAVPEGGEVNHKLRAAAEKLDADAEQLVQKVLELPATKERLAKL